MMPPKKGARAEVKSVIDPHEEERRPSINPSNRRVSRPKLPPELSSAMSRNCMFSYSWGVSGRSFSRSSR